jgi:DNA-binding transcriptional regulator YdaS (Cro superfamily)
MNMREYYAGLNREERVDLAKKVQTSVAYLGQIASGHRKAGLEIALLIQRHTNRQVTVEELAGFDPGSLEEESAA